MSLPSTVATLPDPIIVIFIRFNFGKMNIQQKLAIAFIRKKLQLLYLISPQQAGKEAFRLFCTPVKPKKLIEANLFKEAEKLVLDIEHKKIRGFRIQQAGDKTVLLLHGFSSTLHRFEKYAEGFIKKGYSVIAFDAPAHGASEGTTVNALDYKNLIKEIFHRYGPVHGIVAHSFGGIAVSLALEEIPHDENLKLVLIAPATETSSAIDGAFKFLNIKNAGIRKTMDDMIYQISGKNTEWFSVRRAVKNIRANILWFHDEDDDVTPLVDALKVKNDNPPNISFIITKGLGHQRIYRDAEVRKQILEFI